MSSKGGKVFFVFFSEKKKAPKDQLMSILVEINRCFVEIEERKALALERIASALEMKKIIIIRFNHIMKEEYLSLFKTSLKLALLFD